MPVSLSQDWCLLKLESSECRMVRNHFLEGWDVSRRGWDPVWFCSGSDRCLRPFPTAWWLWGGLHIRSQIQEGPEPAAEFFSCLSLGLSQVPWKYWVCLWYFLSWIRYGLACSVQLLTIWLLFKANGLHMEATGSSITFPVGGIWSMTWEDGFRPREDKANLSAPNTKNVMLRKSTGT